MMTPEEMQSFHETLANAKHVVALCGAGLSAAFGLDVSLFSLMLMRHSVVRIILGVTG